MSVKYVYSNKNSVDEIINEIKNELGNFDSKMLIYFSSSKFNQEELGSKIYNEFKDIETFGCSTSGEIISGKMLKDSVVVMAFDTEVIEDVKVEVVENISKEANIVKAFGEFEKHFNISMGDIDFNKYVGLILIDGLSLSEERVMDKIGDLTNVTFIGASAGDDLKFEKTYVYHNGKVYNDSVVLALLKPTKGFEIIKTQSFKALNQKLTATKVDELNRTVLEFNNKPALDAYAEKVDVDPSNAEKKFMSNPVGVVSGQEIFVRSPQKIEGNSIKFYCNILEGMDVFLLESTDMIEDTKKAIDSKIKEVGEISALINFNCILRTLELYDRGIEKEFGEIFSDIPTVGFSTYGEQYIGHINQTATMLLLK